MGRRSATESLAAVYQAFLRRRTWAQKELAGVVGISTSAVRKLLEELGASGVPLERGEDHPHVYWSVPAGWFPGGLVLNPIEAVELLRQLSRLPRGEGNDVLLKRVREALPASRARVDMSVVITPTASETEETWLRIVEDAAAQGVSLRMQYFTASRGTIEWRHVSVHRVKAAPPARFTAVCHRQDRLKWFRLDGVLQARLDGSEPFRRRTSAEVEALLAQSIDGFHRNETPTVCRFFVRAPESTWVARNLPEPTMQAEPVPGGIHVTATTGAVLRLARYVVGLGSAARSETPELATLVAELARGALEASSGK